MPKLESPVVHIKASPEKFYNFFKNRYDLFPIYSSSTTKSIKVVPEQTTPTALVYTAERFVGDGRTVTMTERIEEDKENNSLVATLIDGNALLGYKFVKSVFQIIPKEDGSGSKANLSVEYEKISEHVPTPDHFLSLMVLLTRGIDIGVKNQDALAQPNKPADSDASSDDD